MFEDLEWYWIAAIIAAIIGIIWWLGDDEQKENKNLIFYIHVLTMQR